MTDPRLRLVRAQAWVWNNRKDTDILACDRDDLARALAEERPDHPLWGDFAATEVHQMTGVYGTFPHLAKGAYSHVAKRTKVGYTALLRLLWAVGSPDRVARMPARTLSCRLERLPVVSSSSRFK